MYSFLKAFLVLMKFLDLLMCLSQSHVF